MLLNIPIKSITLNTGILRCIFEIEKSSQTNIKNISIQFQFDFMYRELL